jgi:hypothetical protein
VLLVTKFFKKKNLMVVAFMLVGAGLIIPLSASAFTYTYRNTTCSWGGYYPPAIGVSSPTPSQSFTPGENISVKGYVRHHYCNNTSNTVYASVWNWDGSEYKKSTIANRPEGRCYNRRGTRVQCNYHTDYSDYFSFNITAPSSSGDYNFYLRGQSYNGCANDVSEGYQDYKVHVNGSCGSFNGMGNVGTLPTGSQACSAGSSTPVSINSSNMSWSCDGLNGGTNASCSATATSSSCGPANGGRVNEGGTINSSDPNICSPSTDSSLYGQITADSSGTWSWACKNEVSSSASCTAQCAPGTYYCSASNICSSACALAAPQNLVAETATLANSGANYCGGKIKLSWNSVSGATGYKLYRSTSLNGTYDLITPLGIVVTNYLNTAGNSGQTFYYKVTAYNDSMESAYSAVSSAQSSEACPPPNIVKFDATSASGFPIVGKGNQCLLSWEVTGAESCSINGPGVSDQEVTIPTGQYLTPAIDNASIYFLSCDQDGTSFSKSATCLTQPSFREI